MAMEAEPVAGPKIGNAAGDAIGRRAAPGEERPPANAPSYRIIPAVPWRVQLVEDEGLSFFLLIAHWRSLSVSAVSHIDDADARNG